MRDLVREIGELQRWQGETEAQAAQDQLEGRRKARRLEVLMSELEAIAEERASERSGLMPLAGVEAVRRWLDSPSPGSRRSVSQLAEDLKSRRSRQHVGDVLARQRDCSPGLAADIAAVTGIAVELLLPVAAERSGQVAG